ncbi:MAG: hypothetical protein H7096_05385 [Flavobacterium sp.]|nr:hypothetical protein [Pedobacter sp.]
MKKTASIFLLFVFLFNIIGYKAFFFYLEQQADIRIASTIQSLNELDKRLITVKIPINLPYQTDWREFESIDGEMNFKGKTYKYVKRKVLRDTLILLCIDHTEKYQIEQNSADYYKKVNDLTSETNKKPVLKQAKTDYYQEVKNLLSSLPIIINIRQDRFLYTLEIHKGFSQKLKMPPRVHTS